VGHQLRTLILSNSDFGALQIIYLLTYFSDFRRVDSTHSRDIRDQSRKLSEIWTFFAFPNFRGRAFQKLYPRYHPCLASRRLKKFREDIPTCSEVIGAHTLNFRPNFKCSRLIFLGGGDLVPFGVCASKPWSISSTCKNRTEV